MRRVISLRCALPLLCFLGVALMTAGVACAQNPPRPQPADTTALSDGSTLSGPYIYKNLSVWLVHNKKATSSKQYLTLQEALQAGKVKVFETGSVNQLSIQNLSKTQDVFIQAGDIVKGGRQDRTVQNDMILSANSGKVPLNSYCVEHGRWTGRGGESSAEFSSSNLQLSSRELKLAAKYSNNQSEVWASVKKSQDKIAENGAVATDPRSETSLQLTLEGKDVEKNLKGYMGSLEKITVGKKDVIGYVFAINGQINSADLYCDNALFAKLWNKLLRSACTEAFTESNADSAAGAKPAVATGDVKGFLGKADNGQQKRKAKDARAINMMKETDQEVVFETRDDRAGAADRAVHKNYLIK